MNDEQAKRSGRGEGPAKLRFAWVTVNCEGCGKPMNVPESVATRLKGQEGEPILCGECDEPNQERKRQQVERRRIADVREDLPSVLAACGVPPIFRDAAFDQCPDLPPELVEAGRAWAATRDGFLYLCGTVGSGKTWLAAAILRHVLWEGLMRPIDCIFTSEHEHLRRLKAAMDAEPGQGRATRDLAAVRLLVLDDLGSTYATPWAKDQMAQIVTVRHEWKRPTVITSNLSPGDLAGVADERIASRISQLRQVFAFPKRDLRRHGALKRTVAAAG